MPHLIIEYSRNIEDRIDIGAICEKAKEAILATGLFEVGAVRVRAHVTDAYAIADSHPDNGFMDIIFRIGTGRTPSEKKLAGEAILAAVETQVTALLARPHFALSLEINEIDPEFSWRKNVMHSRLRAA
jgi:5-carboxymethyl-2-hydroxymuconate isomerase